MGLFSGLGRALKGVVSKVAPITSLIPGPIGAASMLASSVVSPPRNRGATGLFANVVPSSMVGTTGRIALPRSRSVTRRAPQAAGLMDLLPDIGVEGPGIFTARGCPPGYHLAKDGSGRCVRNRRMNPLNHRANMRAARRLVAFRKAVVRTEKALRKAVPPSARRRAPAGHRARLTHQ